MSTPSSFSIRSFEPTDEPKLQAMAAAINAAGAKPRPHAVLSESQPGLIFLVADAGELLLGTALASLSPGAMAMIFSPLSTHPAAPAPAAIEDALLHAVLLQCAAAGQKLAYVALPLHAEAADAAPFARAGFRTITDLVYLRRSLTDLPAAEALDDARSLSFTETPDRFADALLASYQGTLDCPELDGLRTPAEILMGHAAVGVGGVSRWRLIERGGVSVGVQLLAEISGERALELVYFGLVPSARRRGWGRRLLTQILHEARQEGFGWVTLSVDVRNEPAMKLYASLGFVPFDRRRLILLHLNKRAQPASAS